MAADGTVPEIQLTGFDASHTPTLYLTLFVLFPVTLHFNIIHERRATKKRKITGAQPCGDCEREPEQKVMPVCCHSALVPFWLCLLFFLIIMWQWADSRNRLWGNYQSPLERSALPAYLKDLLEFNTSGQTHILRASAAIKEHLGALGSKRSTYWMPPGNWRLGIPVLFFDQLE